MQQIPITPGGAERLRTELQRLLSVERPNIVKAIEVARAHGDLSENAEYQYAKEKQGFIEARIRELENRVARLQVIDPAQQSGDKVRFGATVKLLDMDSDEELQYQIVGEDETDANNGRLSVRSPIARALIGKEEGDEVKVKVPRGLREFEILEISWV